MSCKRNINHRSALQFVNRSVQTIPTTATALGPVAFELGNAVTDTGCAIELESNSIEIDKAGTYRITANLVVTSTAAGEITIALAMNGVELPETIRIINVAAGNTFEVPIDTVRYVHPCWNPDKFVFTIIGYSGGAGTATVNVVAGNVVKIE